LVLIRGKYSPNLDVQTRNSFSRQERALFTPRKDANCPAVEVPFRLVRKMVEIGVEEH